MASSIPYAQTGISNLKAPDLSKAGDLFNTALTKATSMAETAKANLQDEQKGLFATGLREAGNLQDLTNVNIEGLRQADLDSAALQQAQAQLQERQLALLGTELQGQYDTRLAENKPIVENILANNPAIANFAGVDESGTINFAEGTTPEQEAQFGEVLRQSEFVPVRTEREYTKDIIQRAKTEFNASDEQAKKLAADHTAYRKSLNTLTSEENALYVAEEVKLDQALAHERLGADRQLARIERETKHNPTEAQALLSMKASTVKDTVDELANISSWRDFFAESGEELKRTIDGLYKKGVNNNTVQPWMVDDALRTLIDTAPDTGSKAINIDDMITLIDGIARDSVLQQNLLTAANAKRDIDQNLLNSEQRTVQDKKKALARIKKDALIRDTAFNRAAYNRVLDKAVEAQNNVVADPETTGGAKAFSLLDTGNKKPAAITAPITVVQKSRKDKIKAANTADSPLIFKDGEIIGIDPDINQFNLISLDPELLSFMSDKDVNNISNARVKTEVKRIRTSYEYSKNVGNDLKKVTKATTDFIGDVKDFLVTPDKAYSKAVEEARLRGDTTKNSEANKTGTIERSSFDPELRPKEEEEVVDPLTRAVNKARRQLEDSKIRNLQEELKKTIGSNLKGKEKVDRLNIQLELTTLLESRDIASRVSSEELRKQIDAAEKQLKTD
jgi:hypothetical protein